MRRKCHHLIPPVMCGRVYIWERRNLDLRIERWISNANEFELNGIGKEKRREEMESLKPMIQNAGAGLLKRAHAAVASGKFALLPANV